MFSASEQTRKRMATMTRLKRRRLIAAMAALLIGFPQLCSADQAVLGSWTGTQTYSEEDYVNRQIVDVREIVNPWSTPRWAICLASAQRWSLTVPLSEDRMSSAASVHNVAP